MTALRHIRPVFAMLALALSAGAWAQTPGTGKPRIPPKYPASPLEIANLPKYCYNQYVDGALGGREFSITADSCGYEMNHFCPALVYLYRAGQFDKPKNERRGAINDAVKDIEYTLRGMKPGCYITQDVHQAKSKAQMLSSMSPR